MNAQETISLAQEIITSATNLCKELNYWHDEWDLAQDVIVAQEKLEILLAIYQQENNE